MWCYNPFPGMNPYLEHSDIWPNFRNELTIRQLRTTLGLQLPGNYRIALGAGARRQRLEARRPV